MPARTNLHRLALDLPEALGKNLGQASWERIFEAVEAEVLNCIPFGTFQVSEAVIGDYFDVSRTVVRDVLSRMDSRGLISKDRSLEPKAKAQVFRQLPYLLLRATAGSS